MLSIIIPLFNEQESLPLLLARLVPIAASIDPTYRDINSRLNQLDARRQAN